MLIALGAAVLMQGNLEPIRITWGQEQILMTISAKYG